MSARATAGIYDLYRAAITPAFESSLRTGLGLKRHKRAGGQPKLVYDFCLLIWLMMTQQLEGAGTLAEAVGRAASGRLKGLVRRRVSLNTGGYSRARSRMPVAVMREATNYLNVDLQRQLIEADERAKRPITLFDGSSVSLAPEPELARAYPPWSNKQGRSHFPVLKMVVAHDARSGLALDANWGPMYGRAAASEQGLAIRLLDRLTAQSIVMGDRNFGIFWMAYESVRRGHDLILRLSKERAERMAGGARKPGTDEPRTWTPSAWERRKHQEWAAEAEVQGRLLVCEVAGFKEPLYLFTTLSLPASEVALLYKLRWNVETDLRSIKQVVKLEQIRAKSPDMLEKELLAALAAYNLTRAVIVLASRQVGLAPRELSFSRVFYLVKAWLPRFLDAARESDRKREFRRLAELAGTCKLPRRKKPRSFSRAVWVKRNPYPQRKESRPDSCK